MGEHMNLDRLGTHVSASLEQAREKNDAASRVRARLARGEARTRVSPMAPRIRIRTGALLGALAVAATLLLGSFRVWRESRRPLTFVVGGANAATVSGGASNGTAPAFLAAPADAELPIVFSDGTHVSVAAGAHARIADVTSRGARVLVESGVVHASVVHRSDTRWLVDAGPFEVKVTGTRFDVAWQPGEQAIVVTLHEGSVVVTGCGLADGQRVSGGQQLHASCKTGAATLEPLAPNAPNAPNALAGPPAPATPTLVVASASAEPIATAASSLPDAPREHDARAPGSSVRSTTTTAATAIAAAPAAATAAPASPLATLTASELLARANADRYAGRFDAAIESLDAVRRRFRGSEHAATAAFELGRIAFDGQRDFGAAGDWFETYLRERPSGALAREALGRAIEARQRGGDAERAEQLATRYVAMYPDGPHATLARRLAARPGASP